MAHSFHHAESSARKFGGKPEDYLAVHTWFDATKQHLSLPGHRALRHHAAGIWESERVFGTTLTNSDGRVVPVRFVGEQHVRDDCRCIPTVSDCMYIKGQSYRARTVIRRGRVSAHGLFSRRTMISRTGLLTSKGAVMHGKKGNWKHV